MRKSYIQGILALFTFVLLLAAQAVYAHSARTNAAGCHTNSRTGDYHCHNAPAPKLPITAPTIQQVPATGNAISDQKIRQLLIQRSIAGYSGNCPCPYNRASNGSRCGGRSAYSRPGGASPLCYDRDITPQMIANHRTRIGN